MLTLTYLFTLALSFFPNLPIYFLERVLAAPVTRSKSGCLIGSASGSGSVIFVSVNANIRSRRRRK